MLRKNAFTLLELLISITLAAILMTVLLSAYKEITKIHHQLRKTEKVTLERTALNTRLEQALSEIVGASQYLPNVKPLYTEWFKQEQTLHFIYNNQIDPSPYFSGPLYGKFFLRNGDFILESIPTHKDARHKREEIIMTHVSAFSFEFFQEEKGEYFWVKNFDNKDHIVPSMMRLRLTKDEENLTFSFLFSTNHPEIQYKAKG